MIFLEAQGLMAPGRLSANICGHSISLEALNITLLIPKPVLVPELRGEDVAPGRTVRVEWRWVWESGWPLLWWLWCPW